MEIDKLPHECVMSNTDLTYAIKYAFECCANAYTSGSPTERSEAGKLMLAHLQKLTDVQAARAALLRANFHD